MNIDCKQITDTWKLYTLQNDNMMQVGILNYGGIIVNLVVPDKNGKRENVVLGYENMTDYADNPTFFGALIGRVAGRIQNASFCAGENMYTLEANEGDHHLHGGSSGFHQVIWDSEPFQNDTTVGVKLIHRSANGAGGYPGNVEATVTYTLTNANELILDYTGTTDSATPLSMTNHTYFNLSGDLKNTIHDHNVTMDSSHFVALNHELIPTGKLVPVDGTPFDFRSRRKLRDGINPETEQNKIAGNGYDHFFTFDNEKQDNIIITEDNSGRVLRIQTNQPGVVMYTANGLPDNLQLTKGHMSKKHLGVCFETQAHPASLHHEGFPSIILKPDETYQKRTVFSFGIMY